jgi:adenylate kinase
MPQILLLGQHGAGKSTLGRELARRDQVLFLSAGELIRTETARGSPSLQRIGDDLADGGDAPEEFSYGLLSRALESDAPPGRSVILDGYPRYATQIRRLHAVLGRPPEAAVLLHAPTELLVHRSRTRAECVNCHAIYGEAIVPAHAGECDLCGGELINRPEDDDVDVITRRHRVWQKEAEAIVLGIEELSEVIRIDATQSPQRVYEQTRELLSRW